MPHGHDRESENAALASTVDAGENADVLSDVLQAVRLTGALFFIVDASPPWAAAAPAGTALASVLLPRAQRVISYHVVRKGRCWCEVTGEPPITLEPGDVVILPHGDPYVLSDTRGGRAPYSVDDALVWFRQMAAGELPMVTVEGGGGAGRISVLCGFLGCDVVPFNPVLATLPRLLHLRRPRKDGADRLTLLLEFLASEARDRRAGQRNVLLRTGELLFVEVVRRHLAALRPGQSGWLAGLRDPVVGRALAALHGRPARPWTLAEIAKHAGSSRSALADRFTRLVGQPPMQYLARWRLQLAALRLETDDAKVSAVTREVGYDSEAAFSRAFKKLVGRSPAAWRAAPGPTARRVAQPPVRP
jgi:AraC-like DNA-binding protein